MWKYRTYKNALKQRAVNVYATVKQHLKISAWYAHILFYLVAHVYACMCTSAKAQTDKKKKRTKHRNHKSHKSSVQWLADTAHTHSFLTAI